MALISIKLEKNKTPDENGWRLAVQLHPVELQEEVGQI